ncbi:MAG: type VI secretion system baseplate subunit TssK [Pseudomonadota bacterium]
MSNPLKVLWGEGFFLRPQHFQQQDQYHEARLRHTAHALHPYLWGVRGLTWDLEALKSNRLRASTLSAIFRDGQVVDAPESDVLPPAVDLAALPATLQEITYYAALPSLNLSGANVTEATPQVSNMRFSQVERNTTDLYTKAKAEQIIYLKSALRLVSDLEPLGGYDCFPVIRLRRTVSSGFELDPAFIPPSLSVGATPPLKEQLDKLMDALQAKVHALQGHMREHSTNIIEFRSGDVSSFWLLHTVSSAAATLSHYVHNSELHPERLFEALLGLAGGLMTYSKQLALRDLPAYLHDDPGACFGRLDSIIRELLDTVISTKYFAIALKEIKPSYYLGKLDSGKIDQTTTLYLAVSASVPALELVKAIPLRIKIGAPDDVEKCVMAAMPGVALSHAPRVPAAIPVRPDTYYFALDNKGVLYEQMMKAQSISVYAPSGTRDLRLELIAVTA